MQFRKRMKEKNTQKSSRIKQREQEQKNTTKRYGNYFSVSETKYHYPRKLTGNLEEKSRLLSRMKKDICLCL